MKLLIICILIIGIVFISGCTSEEKTNSKTSTSELGLIEDSSKSNEIVKLFEASEKSGIFSEKDSTFPNTDVLWNYDCLYNNGNHFMFGYDLDGELTGAEFRGMDFSFSYYIKFENGKPVEFYNDGLGRKTYRWDGTGSVPNSYFDIDEINKFSEIVLKKEKEVMIRYSAKEF